MLRLQVGAVIVFLTGVTLAVLLSACGGGDDMPETVGSPTLQGTARPGEEQAGANTPEGLARRAVPLLITQDWGAFLQLVRPDQRDELQERFDRGTSPIDDVTGCATGAEEYLVEEEFLGEVNVVVLFDTECVVASAYGSVLATKSLELSFEKVSGRWWVSRGY